MSDLAARRAMAPSMFTKPGMPGRPEDGVAPANDGPAPAAQATAHPSVIAANAEFTGSVATTAELQVQGTVKGDVRGAKIVICAGGAVKGDIVGETVIVHGTTEGRIFGENVRICAGAEVNGDVRHRSLGIDPAASFEGSVKRVDNPIADASAPHA